MCALMGIVGAFVIYLLLGAAYLWTTCDIDPKSAATEPCKGKKIQVFTDVDDTYKCSHASIFAGCDTSYGKNVVYPGFSQFVLEIARTRSESEDVLNPAVMSARPGQFREILGMRPEGTAAMAMNAFTLCNHNASMPTEFDQYNADMCILDAQSVQASNWQNAASSKGHWQLNTPGSFYGQIWDAYTHQQMGCTKLKSFQSFFDMLRRRDVGSRHMCCVDRG